MATYQMDVQIKTKIEVTTNKTNPTLVDIENALKEQGYKYKNGQVVLIHSEQINDEK